MNMAADLRKPRAIMSHPKIKRDYATFHEMSARKARRERRERRIHALGWAFVCLSSIGAVVFMLHGAHL
jgi:hypothetical protein